MGSESEKCSGVVGVSCPLIDSAAVAYDATDMYELALDSALMPPGTEPGDAPSPRSACWEAGDLKEVGGALEDRGASEVVDANGDELNGAWTSISDRGASFDCGSESDEGPRAVESVVCTSADTGV